MIDWTERAAERLLDALAEIENAADLQGTTEAARKLWIAQASSLIAAEYERAVCEKLNTLPMYGNDWGAIADALWLSVDPLNGFVPRSKP